MSAVTTTTASELREAFKLFDADDNGEVTVAELNKYAQRNKHCKFKSHDHHNTGFLFVHFFAGSLRPAACGALSFQGKKLSFGSKNISFFTQGGFFGIFSKEKPALG